MRKFLASLLILLAVIRADAQSIYGGSWLYSIGQVAIPFILPSSGTMGDNGALSGLTAMQVTYANAYIYMPAGAIVVASAAGWYFAQCSSTTACTVFNNAYTSGVPTIPASPTPFVTTGPGAYTQTISTNIVGPEIPILGNTMGPRGEVSVLWSISCPTNANSKSFVARSGAQGAGSTFINTTVTTSTNNTSVGALLNRGVTNSQVSSNINGSIGGSGASLSYQSMDTTQTQWLNFGTQITVATDYVVTEFVAVNLSPAW